MLFEGSSDSNYSVFDTNKLMLLYVKVLADFNSWSFGLIWSKFVKEVSI